MDSVARQEEGRRSDSVARQVARPELRQEQAVQARANPPHKTKLKNSSPRTYGRP